LARHKVEIIASMPCYTAENVNAQRGQGVFDSSIKALRVLNSLGYGSDLPLHLVYNPVAAFLPGPQAELEADYKRELKKHFGIIFNNLYTITNLPIARFASYLRHNNKLEEYMQLLIDNFNPATVFGLMCRNTISVGWTGEVFDCDFNQMLNMNWRNGSGPLHLWDLDPAAVENREILTGNHCFGCAAGAGSSCAGALVYNSPANYGALKSDSAALRSGGIMLVFRRVEAGVSPASERSWSVLQPGIKTVPRLRLP